MNMTAVEIIKDYLVKNNFGGLWNPEGACGCKLSDLMPCDNMDAECKPGYGRNCTECSVEDCNIKSETDCEWCIHSEKG